MSSRPTLAYATAIKVKVLLILQRAQLDLMTRQYELLKQHRFNK